MTHLDTAPPAGSSPQGADIRGTLSRVLRSGVLRSGVAQRKKLIAPKRWGRGLFPRAAGSLVFALCVMTLALAPARSTLFAQPPNVELPQQSTDGTTATPPSVPSLPSDLDFDIDLGTDEFENFGEEGFQVEEANYFRDTVVPIAIKVAIGAVVILLLAWVAMKLVKPKPPTPSE